MRMKLSGTTEKSFTLGKGDIGMAGQEIAAVRVSPTGALQGKSSGGIWTDLIDGPDSGIVYDESISTGSIAASGSFKQNLDTGIMTSGMGQAFQASVTAGASDKVKLWLYNGDPDSGGSILYAVTGAPPDYAGHDLSTDPLDDRNVFWLAFAEGALWVKVQNLATTAVTVGLRIRVSEGGPAGPTGATGATGSDGPEGPEGPAGEGVPAGGAAGQILSKASATDYDTQWVDPPEDGRWVDFSTTGISATGNVHTFNPAADGYFRYEFIVTDGTNMTDYTVSGHWDDSAGTVQYRLARSEDTGDASGISFGVDMDSGLVRLRATVISGTWAVHGIVHRREVA